MEPDYLNEITRRAESYRSYSNYSYGNYSKQEDYRSYVNSNSSNYTDEDKQTLKRFYKKLAMEFHRAGIQMLILPRKCNCLTS